MQANGAYAPVRHEGDEKTIVFIIRPPPLAPHLHRGIGNLKGIRDYFRPAKRGMHRLAIGGRCATYLNRLHRRGHIG